MRPTAIFACSRSGGSAKPKITCHAILAACLAALAAASAAAKPQIDNEGHAYLTMSLMGSGGASHGQKLEVHGFTWGPRQSALKLDRNTVKSWSTSGDASGSDPKSHGDWIADVERPAPGGGGSNELGMDDTAGKENARQGDSMLGASERIAVGGSQTEGQATGKRQHKPFVARGYYD